jgi:ABC-type transporter Mla maintaining outer membrane lipid asymmetry ATPase subunit MlaF
MSTFSLCNEESGNRCAIELGRGLSYLVSVRTHGELDVLTEQLLELPATRVADNVGGLVNNITILENIALPVLYHRMVTAAELDPLIVQAFADCGLDGEAVDVLCSKRPGDASAFEKRLAGFVRCLVSRPEILVYSRFLEGLTRADMARAAALNSVFRMRNPNGTAIYLMLNDMPDLEPECHGRHEL